MSDLSPKQRRFVAEYLIDPNATQAAIRAGYSEKTAKAQGSRLLTNVYVRRAVVAGQARLAAKAELSAERVVEEYRRLAFADIRSVIEIREGKVVVKDTDELLPEQAVAIAEIAETKDGIRVKLASKQAALDSLAKHLGMFTENVNVNQTGPAPIIQLIPISKPAERE